MKQVQRSAGAVAIETAAFAGMAGTVAGLAVIILGEFTLLGGILVGGAIGAVIFGVMWILMQGTFEPPRGPGNIRPTRTPLTRDSVGVATAGKTVAPKPATTTAAQSPAQTAQPKAEVASTQASSGSATGGTKPTGLAGPREGGADDLKRIKGIGPKLEDALNAEGYYHYDQIAAWNAGNVAWVDENLVGFKGRATRDDWVGQAKGLMADGTTG